MSHTALGSSLALPLTSRSSPPHSLEIFKLDLNMLLGLYPNAPGHELTDCLVICDMKDDLGAHDEPALAALGESRVGNVKLSDSFIFNLYEDSGHLW